MENEKTKRQEELQSRRDFFKKAAKGVLPILGAVVLANTPLLSSAAEKTPMECDGCSGSCKGNCSYGCQGSCRGGCAGQCGGGCKGSCYGCTGY